jgi:hypothetical protein
MADPEGTQRVRIGVRLAPRPKDLGGWLADGAAFEAAGADALWIDLAAEMELDPLTVTAALAAVTYRSLLVSALPLPGPPTALATVGRLSRGRLRIVSDTVGDRYRLDPAQRWAPVPPPDSRATWRAMLVDAAGRGWQGLVVPADPRLIDLLRNPDDPGERLDLQLAQG